MGGIGSTEVAVLEENKPEIATIAEVKKDEQISSTAPHIPTPEDESRDDPATATKKKLFSSHTRTNSNSIIINSEILEALQNRKDFPETNSIKEPIKRKKKRREKKEKKANKEGKKRQREKLVGSSGAVLETSTPAIPIKKNKMDVAAVNEENDNPSSPNKEPLLEQQISETKSKLQVNENKEGKEEQEDEEQVQLHPKEKESIYSLAVPNDLIKDNKNEETEPSSTPLGSRNISKHKEPSLLQNSSKSNNNVNNSTIATKTTKTTTILTNWKNPLRFQKKKDFHYIVISQDEKNNP